MARSSGRIKRFFTSVTGLLGTLATLITGVAAILALVVHHNDQTNSPRAYSPVAVQTTSTQQDSDATATWASRANQICQRVKAQNPHTYTSSDPPAQRLIETAGITVTYNEIDQDLQALSAPASSQSAIDKMISDWRDAATDMSAAGHDIVTGDTAGEQSEVAHTIADADQGDILGQTLGLNSCTATVT